MAGEQNLTAYLQRLFRIETKNAQQNKAKTEISYNGGEKDK